MIINSGHMKVDKTPNIIPPMRAYRTDLHTGRILLPFSLFVQPTRLSLSV